MDGGSEARLHQSQPTGGSGSVIDITIKRFIKNLFIGKYFLLDYLNPIKYNTYKRYLKKYSHSIP